MSDEVQAGEFWEPVRFDVGQRVRIHRSDECPYPADYHHAASFQDGTVGQVHMLYGETFGGSTSDGHDVFVVVATDAEGRCQSGWFAACELIPDAGRAALAAAEGSGESQARS